MHETSAPAAVRRHTAAGKKLNYLLALLATTAAYVAFVMLSPQITAYELGGAIKPVCVTRMNDAMYEYSDNSLNWEKDWKSRYRRLAIPLRDDQWRFTVSSPCHPKQGCTCTGEAVFELETPWFLLADFFDIPPYKSTHHVKRDVDYKTHY